MSTNHVLMQCDPDIVINRKTEIPHSLKTLPGLRWYQREISDEFFLKFPHISCVTVPMIWTLRSVYDRASFRQWFDRILPQVVNRQQAFQDLELFEQWFVKVPPSAISLSTTMGFRPEWIHSGWFIDVPGLNPEMGELYYSQLFNASNVYQWILRDRSSPEQVVSLLTHDEDPIQVIGFLRQAKIVVK